MTTQKAEMFSDKVAHEIDEEMRSIINECYDKTKKIIIENRKLLDLIANTLLEQETITKEQIDYLVEHGYLPQENKENEDTEKLNEENSKDNQNKKSSKKNNKD